MQIRISDCDGIPICQQIVNQVKFLVGSGHLEEGERLPAVRRLAEQLLINPNTVARAYRQLESEGVVTARKGAGVFVSGEGSPLARREKLKLLTERIDALLTEALQLDINLETVLRLRLIGSD